ncbi:hypothetical protein ETH_00041675, partial [Eimeria tenella]
MKHGFGYVSGFAAAQVRRMVQSPAAAAAAAAAVAAAALSPLLQRSKPCSTPTRPCESELWKSLT